MFKNQVLKLNHLPDLGQHMFSLAVDTSTCGCKNITQFEIKITRPLHETNQVNRVQ